MGLGRGKEDRPTPPEVYNWRVYMICLGATLGESLSISGRQEESLEGSPNNLQHEQSHVS